MGLLEAGDVVHRAVEVSSLARIAATQDDPSLASQSPCIAGLARLGQCAADAHQDAGQRVDGEGFSGHG